MFSQTWQTVEDFQYVVGDPCRNMGMVVGPSGTVFACGIGQGAGGYHGLVMASADSGNTWSRPLDDFLGPLFLPCNGIDRCEGGIACDSTGNLYRTARANISSQPTAWLVRRSTDGGVSWAAVDYYQFSGTDASPYACTQPYGIAAYTAGNVYVAGVVEDTTNGISAWTVRKGVGGTNYYSVDSFSPAGYGSAQAIFAHPSAGVIAVGSGYITLKKGTSQAWMVRRSADGGATWSTVDIFQFVSGYYSQAYGVGADVHGNIDVVGQANAPYQGGYYAHWVVRKSTDGGNTWTTADNFQLSPTDATWATAFAADSNGNLFVAGIAEAVSWGWMWIVRENPRGSGAWTTVDNFQYAGGQTGPTAIVADGFGNVFVGGQGYAANGVHWLVRRN